MNVKKDADHYAAPNRCSGCKRRVIFQPEEFVFYRTCHPVLDPENDAQNCMTDDTEEQEYFNESDDRVRNQELPVCLIYLPAVIRKQEKIPYEVFYKK